jgi:hypothetical protein
MKRLVVPAAFVAALLSASAIPAAAYDPLCDKIGDATRRDLCRCRSDAGAKVSYRPDDSGKMKVRESGVSSRKLGQVNECMQAKGHRV